MANTSEKLTNCDVLGITIAGIIITVASIVLFALGMSIITTIALMPFQIKSLDQKIESLIDLQKSSKREAS